MHKHSGRRISLAILLALFVCLFLLSYSAALSGDIPRNSDTVMSRIYSELLSSYLPIVNRSEPTPTPTQKPIATTGDIHIMNIVFDGGGSYEADEYVEFKNVDNETIQLLNWTLSDESSIKYTFPSFLIKPNQSCRVYTNVFRPEWCGFSYGRGSGIWNNGGDTATLRDANGTVIDVYTYP
jgi:hypothetical protein